MSGTMFDRALRASMDRVTGEPLWFDQWAATVIECDRAFAAAGIVDHTVRATAATARLVSDPVANLMAAEFTAINSQALTTVQREEARLAGRTALRFATHAAARNASGVKLAVLLGIERELTPAPPPDQPLHSAMADWRIAVAACGLSHPGPSVHLSAAIATNQVLLLSHCLQLLDRVESISVATDMSRLRAGVEASRESWRQARADFKFATFGGRPHDADALSTRRLAAAVDSRNAALVSNRSAEQVLHAVLQSGFAGNLVAGLVVGRSSPDVALPVINAAHQLQQIVDPLPDDPFRDVPLPAAPVLTAAAPEPTREVPTSYEPGAGVLVEPVRLTPASEIELAKRRDVGILAHAALACDPVASSITSSVSEGELRGLAADGRQAQAQMVVSALPASRGAQRSVLWFNKEEALQAAVVELMEATARWNPDKSRWLTYATATAGWAAKHWIRDDANLPLPFDTDSMPANLADPGLTPAEVAERSEARTEAAHLVEWIKRQGEGELTAVTAQVLLARHGLDGQPPRTFGQVAAELGFSEATARRYCKEGLQVLRQAGPFPESTQPPAVSSRAQIENRRRRPTPHRTTPTR
ncbi:sigma-70 family RNA polymerase sigma factor [Tessaracoccus rhinocerotis]|uniref:Sigma-70 family RNA polymerase sigma factor n=1 Tax=Tessaracoccus rhinocerotis TaxID=1689449 RepID=A0A553K3Y8_9ACTN|nr:sigma-70 family RNA polymerase sigma factor [Tessaracoccus rhinocerotis]TRY19423.1 sigma-70 family RNA polymerase sigma factor [Tessaracoccus rhinocerotis]